MTSLSLALALALALTCACTSSDSTSTLDASTQDATADVVDASPIIDVSADIHEASTRDASANCVKPGTPGNEKSMGGYCEKTKDCARDAGFRVCTSEVGAPDDGWFCTGLCTTDVDCGSGMFCRHEAQGSGCVPLTCASPSDGGVDGDNDASDAGDATGQ